ncbi:GNAT family N-acetyltransferase [Deinococcus alpinitundrae]|uniref:GNAT family N-acetyltransferase n=1 Tax=Deinococcus alpinitundrae TaxID=468913 RepID=UPI001ED93CD7|nr:GNAT family N-acetyltransferase [Deinococcus alpinitundrae]
MTPEGKHAAAPAPAPFDPDAASTGQRLALGQLAAACFAFAYPEDPPQLPEKTALSLGFVTPGERTEHSVIWEDHPAGQAVQALAWGRLEYSLEQNQHLAHIRLLVDPAVRRRGLGRTVLAALTKRAQLAGHTTLTFDTTDRAPAGERFARHFGAVPALINCRSQLDLAQVPDGLLDAWLTRPTGCTCGQRCRNPTWNDWPI